MAPAYCVGQVCVAVEKLPTQEALDAAAQEDARRQVSVTTTTALTRPRKVGELARRPHFQPGQLTG